MKIIIFGATGGVGQHVVAQALEAGHDVTVFVRARHKVTAQNVHIIEGDAFNRDAVIAASAGHDAIISCLGSTEGEQKDTSLQTMGENIAAALQENNISRIVYCASAGVFGEIPGPEGEMVMKMLEKPLKDHKAALDAIMATNVVYTIARPMGLVDTALELDYVEKAQGVPTTSRSIPRASVAHFIVKALTTTHYDNKAVGLASNAN